MDFKSLIFTESEMEVTEIILVLTEAMIQAKDISDRSHMLEMNIFFQIKSRGYNNSRGSYIRSDNYTEQSDSRQSRFRSQSRSIPTWKFQAASVSPSMDDDRCIDCRQHGHFAKNCLERANSVGKVWKWWKELKGCFHLCEGSPEEEDVEEDVMPAMCHSSETYIAIQPNREDD